MDGIFDIVRCYKNQESKRNLFDLIENGEGVLFTGSGISKWLDYPDWKEVIEALSELLSNGKAIEYVKLLISSKAYLHAAEIIKNEITDEEYNQFFTDTFGPKNPKFHEFHKLLVSLKFKGFVTTNYDPVIETALCSIQKPDSNYGISISERDKSKIHYFLNSIVNVNFSERYLLYLHGKYNLPPTTVFTYSDYLEKYDGIDILNKEFEGGYSELLSCKLRRSEFEAKFKLKRKAFRTLHYKAIYPLFATQRLVFVGFSLSDPYLNNIIENVHVDFDPYVPNHFVLFSSYEYQSMNEVDYLELRNEWFKKGVEVVFYDDDTERKGILDFFKKVPPESYVRDGLIPIMHRAGIKEKEANKHKDKIERVEDENINFKLIEKVKRIAEEEKNK